LADSNRHHWKILAALRTKNKEGEKNSSLKFSGARFTPSFKGRFQTQSVQKAENELIDQIIQGLGVVIKTRARRENMNPPVG
jgi:hypothetical protein